ncbi:hypothetical protein SH139x_005663 [Planctomycetaceae bacterium SH139]
MGFIEKGQWLLAIGLCLAGLIAGCGPSGPPRYPLNGTVLINGQPAGNVVVQLHNTNESLMGDDRYPVGLTAADGTFSIGAQAAEPGAVEGAYKVTFVWLSSSELDAVDKFSGGFSDPDKSDYTVIVPVAEPLRFELSWNK